LRMTELLQVANLKGEMRWTARQSSVKLSKVIVFLRKEEEGSK
jgi:hypothetical protein